MEGGFEERHRKSDRVFVQECVRASERLYDRCGLKVRRSPIRVLDCSGQTGDPLNQGSLQCDRVR